MKNALISLISVFIGFVGFVFFPVGSEALPARILLIRHAEKPEVASDHLSVRGFQRAHALPLLFTKHPDYANRGLPIAIYAAAYVPGKTSNRSIETVTPLAASLRLPLQSPVISDDFQKLAQVILQDRRLNGRVVMVAWTHTHITQLAMALGAKPPKPWDGAVFDRVWILDYTASGLHFHDLPQTLLPGDSTRILPVP